MIITAMIDLIRAEYKYKLELHAHTSPGSHCSEVPARQMVDMYADCGFSALTITNHYFLRKEKNNETIKTFTDRYLRDYYEAYDEGAKKGISVILGAEFTLSDASNDYLAYGITEDDLYGLKDINTDNAKAFYKEFRNSRNIIIQAHPFRDGCHYAEGCSDGIEDLNLHTASNNCLSLCADLAAEKQLVKTIGSDAHYHHQIGICATRSKIIPKNSFELADLIRSGDYVFQIGDDIVLPRLYRW